MAHIHVKDASFSYPVYDITGRSLKVSMARQFSGAQSGSGVVQIQALSNISFKVGDGDRLGLIGRNGAGKSTLLRLLSGLIFPQQGGLSTSGRITPLISRGLGIHPELSGFQNIEVPMRLLGASTKEIKLAQGDIPEWSGLGDFIHLPVRTYSDGMRARLMFAICTAVRGDILIMDEWLSAGDADFVEKAGVRMSEFVASAGIVVLSSHSLEVIRSLCNIVCWMERGQIIVMGPPDAVIPAYLRGIQTSAPTADTRINIA